LAVFEKSASPEKNKQANWSTMLLAAAASATMFMSMPSFKPDQTNQPLYSYARKRQGEKKKEQQSQRTAQTASASSTPSSQSKPGKCEVDSMVCRVGQNFRFFHFRLLQSASRYQENLQQLCHEVANLDEKQSPSRFSEVQRQQHHIAMPAR